MKLVPDGIKAFERQIENLQETFKEEMNQSRIIHREELDKVLAHSRWMLERVQSGTPSSTPHDRL